MLIVLFVALVVSLGWFQSQTIRTQLEQRGKSICQSIAATSTNALLNYDYITLEQFANQASNDPGILYVVVHDKEHRVAGYSNRPDLQGQKLTDEVSLNALSATGPLVQQAEMNSDALPGLEVSVPVFLPNSANRWGTVRVCLSLAPMYRQIRQTVLIILSIGLVALGIGITVSIWGAKRVTQPLDNLVQATMNVARGNFDHQVEVKTNDEVEVLASNFSIMTKEILAHQERQEQQLQEIQRLQRYTEKLMTTMSDGLLSVDTMGVVATINPAARALLGIDGEYVIEGRTMASILGETSELYGLIRDLQCNPTAVNQQEIEVARGTEVQTILVGASILRDTAGQPHEIILNLHDVTELKKLEARIRQSKRLAALGTLAAGMAHEIRNPLSAIKTFVQLLPRKIDKPGFLEKFNRTVPRETNRINLLIEELLELSRVPKYEFAATDIKGLLGQAIDIIGGELQHHGIEYHENIQEPLPPVRADANQLVKAFHNLARNAVQAMPTGGCLTVTAFTEENRIDRQQDITSTDDRVTIRFQDTGPGIPPNVLEQIFNPFFTTKDSGTGLGLPITHKVITEHGGQIEAESTEGRGTNFSIHLPVYNT